MSSEQIYNTEWNGASMFRVSILPTNCVTVFNGSCDDSIIRKWDTCKQIFIGKSELNYMTEFSGGHGSKWDGNSLLLHVDANNYAFIGESILTFTSDSPVKSFHSPVGNNRVPYPYAICENGDILLMIEQVVLKSNDALNLYMTSDAMNDPYSYYYKENILVKYPRKKRGKGKNKKYLDDFHSYRDIQSFQIGLGQYELRYSSNPMAEYARFVESGSFEEDNVATHGISIIDKNEATQLLTSDDFSELITSFGHERGFQPMQIH